LAKRHSINWFRLNRELHRDIGYFCVGLTLVFAISGIALNHVRDWNPNYIVERIERTVEISDQLNDDELNQILLSSFAIKIPIKANYWESKVHYKLFFDGGGSLAVNLQSGKAVFESIKPRHVFKEFNRLHLNEARNNWIIFSDMYAGLLLFLSISGLFMVKGKYSAWGWRKSWLVITGGAIPLVYIFMGA